MVRNIVFIFFMLFVSTTYSAQWAENLTLKDGKLTLKTSATASATPATGYTTLYSMPDNFLYFQDSLGTVRNVLLGGSSVLNDLTDVDTVTIPPVNGNGLIYNAGVWEAGVVSGKNLVAGSGVTIVQDSTTATISANGKALAAVSPIVINEDATTATISLGVADYFDFNTSATPAHSDGRLHWDSVNKTLAFDVDSANGIEGQINEELWVEATNNSGAPITDGQAVFIDGAMSGFPTISPASSGDYSKTIGVATQNIAAGDTGKVTMKGTVGGFNTSTYSAGDRLFLSSTIAGALTATRPVSNIVEVAKVLNSQANGKILIDVMPPTDDETLDPTGFLDPTLASASYDYTTRKVTLSGTYKAVWRGSSVNEIIGTWVSPAHAATNGVWFLYYDGASVVWSQTPWTFDLLMIASVYYDGTTNSFGMAEMHGVMDWRAHRNLHLTTGTFLLSGADMSDYVVASTTAANRRPLVSQATVLDEDVATVIASLATESYNQFYLTGTASGTYVFNATDILPVTGTRPNYNQFSSPNWVQTQLSSNAYAAVWLIAIPVTTDAVSQKFRYLWVQPQSESTTLSTIQALSPSSVNLNGLNTTAAEIVFVGKVIVRYVGGGTNNWTVISVEKLVGTKISQSAVTGNFLTNVNTDASFTGDGSVSSPLALSGTVTTTGYHYYGTDADDSFRSYQVGGALVTEKKVSGVWVEVSRIDNL